jgi:coenzyme F420-reducing hydrogenase gamma subunit
MIGKAKPKLRAGFFSFTCDEGCMITFLEILNRKFFGWCGRLEVVYCRQLQKKAEIRGLDVAFVEGAISSLKDKRRLAEIRANTEIMVAMGSCAISGAPSNQRNFFDAKRKEEIAFLLRRFGQLPRVLSVKDLVRVEFEVPGCPIDEKKFIEVMEKILEARHA